MNNPTLEFTKVLDTTSRRCYKLSHTVTKAPNKMFNWENERKRMLEKFKPEHQQLIPNEIEYVIVSDAKTHIERLVFCACEYEPGKFSTLSFMDMDGKLTMMIHGGNPRDVHPDEVYLRRIASVNGMTAKFNF